ncbi:MAG: hypothetical protein DCE90_06500 [Pseudanabaena sp.]|nr:MAG: hypothetical protein DCE90_06500 [Pseudanabaena sp.]
MIIQIERNPVAKILNCAIAPKMYTKTGNISDHFESIYTVVAIFDTRIEARNAILKLQHQGLHSSQVVSISKHYQEHEDSMNWEYVSQDNNLLDDLMGLGIDIDDTYCLELAVNQGRFLVIAIITDCPSTQAHQLFESLVQKTTYNNSQ